MNFQRPIIAFIDSTCSFNTNTIKNSGCGASEYQLYYLLNNLKKYYDIYCFNMCSAKYNIDNIMYIPLDELINYTTINYKFIVIQRFLNLNIYEYVKKYNIYIWMHDNTNINSILKYDSNEILKYKNNNDLFVSEFLTMFNNVNFIYVSEYLKNMSITFFKNYAIDIKKKNQHIIYNALYTNDFIKQNNINKNKNNLVFASSWTKGLKQILDLFDYFLLHNGDLTLTILCPSYSSNNVEMMGRIQNNKNIIFIGNVKKNTYCEIIQNALCVLSPSFLETFGCVFAESYYLGTPVIADINTGAIKEIIDNNFIVDYNNKKEVLDKITDLQNNIYDVILDEKFLDINIIKKWLELN